MTRLFLIRHGEVAGEGMLHGHVDVPLTPNGEQQLRRVAERLGGEPLAAAYSSDLQRARRSAEIVVGERDVPLYTDPAFRELNMGDWDGLSVAQVWKREKRAMEAWWADLEYYTLPGGESMRGMADRVLGGLEELLRKHAGETVALVAHGGTNRVILFAALSLSLTHFHAIAQDYGCLNLIEFYPDGKPVLRLVNG